MKNILKKLYKPILDQLSQGVTPHKLALSIAFGIVIGISPIFGLTTALCVLAAFLFRLNHIAIQAVNYIAYPLQLALVVPFVKLGERIYSHSFTSLNILTILEQFRVSFKIAFAKYFILVMMGVTAWFILAPFIFYLVYVSSKFILVRVLKHQMLQTA